MTTIDITALQQAADDGEAKAQFLLGVSYEIGYRVPQDYALAEKYYYQAATQGCAKARDSLRPVRIRSALGAPKKAYSVCWALTRTGGAFDLLNPYEDDFSFLWDIAPALASIPRFSGIALSFYSVASHCVAGARWLASKGDKKAAAVFLLRDAHEAFIGDIPSPVREALARIGAIDVVADLKNRLDSAIYAAAGLSYLRNDKMASIVKEIDKLLLHTERANLLHLQRSPYPPLDEAPGDMQDFDSFEWSQEAVAKRALQDPAQQWRECFKKFAAPLRKHPQGV